MTFLTKASCGVTCGVRNSNGCMIDLKDWKITEILKISNSPVRFQMHSTTVQLKTSVQSETERGRGTYREGGDSVTDK